MIHPSTIKQPEAPSASDFFCNVCPKVLAERQEICAKLGGVFAFKIQGETGGEWTLDFEAGVVRVGLDEQPDVLVQMSEADFGKLMKGKLDIEEAMRQPGRLVCKGEAGLLTRLGVVLDPRGGAIAD